MGLLFCSALFSENRAQTAYDSLNLQLRGLFQNLARPANPKNFLYEMSAHTVDSSFYSMHSPDTNDIDNFMALASELYAMAHDTTLLPLPEVMYRKLTDAFPHTDTIPLLFLDCEYYTLKPEALSTDTYFEFDTLTNTLTDKAVRPGFPYLTKRLFNVATLRRSTRYANVVFAAHDFFDFFQFDHLESLWNGKVLKVDFGDGQGWKVVRDAQGNITPYHSVVYPTAGEKIIKVGLFEPSGTEVGISINSLVVPNNIQTTPADFTIPNIPGLNVNVWGACNESKPNATQLNKVIIYLEGYDPLDFWGESRTEAEIFQDMIRETGLGHLRNFGYDFVVVNWQNSQKSVQENATYLIGLIHDLINRTRGQGNNEQFVIIGESMGGVIARYALAYMESQEYVNTFSPNPAQLQARHNTRLLMTLDSPHQGANVPMALQKFYRILQPQQVGALPIHGIMSSLPVIKHAYGIIRRKLNILLDSKFAKQTLLYHCDTENPFADPLFPSYSAHPDRAAFLDDIQRVGYPKNCKLMALANGSITGKPQIRRKYNLVPRDPNDFLLDFEANLFVRFLGIKIKILALEVKLRTNPEGKGQLVRVGYGTWGYRLRLRKWGVKVECGANVLLIYDRRADMHAVCTQAGGYNSAKIGPKGTGNTKYIENSFLFSVTRKNSNDGNGTHEFEINNRNIWTGTEVGVGARIYSDGFHFNFVPTLSALDYDAPNLAQGRRPLQPYNILQDPLPLRLSRTPFHIISAIPDAGTAFFSQGDNAAGRELFTSVNYADEGSNMGHLFVRNEQLPDFLQTCNGDPNTARIRGRLLNREIGDEDLYLNNYRLRLPAHFTAEDSVLINTRFPYYTYTDYTPLGNDLLTGALFSKNEPFEILPTGTATLLYEGGYLYNEPYYQFDPQFIPIPGVVPICCINYIANPNTRPTKPEPPASPPTDSESYFKVFPNPNAERHLFMHCKLPEDTNSTLTLRNAQGQVIAIWGLPTSADEQTLEFRLEKYNLPKAIYFLQIQNSKESMVQRLILE